MKRRLSAILAADVVGYSELMGRDETATLAALQRHRREVFEPETAKRGGRIVKLMGDGTLAEFPSVVDAVEAALAIQRASGPESDPIRLRIGVNLGDVIIDGDDIYGDGVNIAARLEALAQPGGICVSSVVLESLGNRVAVDFADLGEQTVKNIDRPIRVFHWPPDAQVPAMPARPKARAGRLGLAVVGLAPLSDDAGLAHFASGLRDALVTELGRFSVLDVTCDPAGACYLLEGSVQTSPSRMRVSAQLRDAGAGAQVWADRVDGDASDLLDFQDDAARRIAGNLFQPLVNHAVARARDLPVAQATACDHYLRSLQHIERPTAAGLAIAFDESQLALEKDPTFALVYEHLAWVHLHRAHNAWADDPIAALEAAADEATEGIRHDDKEAYLRSARAMALIQLGRRDEALRDAELAVRLSPADGEHVVFHAAAMGLSGAFEAALERFAESDRLIPGYPPAALFRGHALLATSNPTQAARSLGDAVLALPDYGWGWAHLAVALQLSGDATRAEHAVAMVRKVSPAMTLGYLERLMTFGLPDLRTRLLDTLDDLGLPG